MSARAPTVAVGCVHEHLGPVPADCTTIVIDVIRATTTAITAAEAGRRVFPAASMEAAVRLAADLERPILAGELGGVRPYGFDLQNSPVELLALDSSSRPIILLSTSGTRLIMEAVDHGPTELCCLRNVTAQAQQVLASGRDALILGADSRGEFREEDQLCAARVAAVLLAGGYRAADRLTNDVIDRWADASDDAFTDGRSATYLRHTGQQHDLDFVLEHIDDLSAVYSVQQGEVVRCRATEGLRR